MAEIMKIMGHVQADDGVGGRAETPAVIATIRPRSVMPVRGAEGSDAGALRATATYLIVMRRRDDLGPDNYFFWVSKGDERLNIREIRDPGPRQTYMTVVAETGDATA